MVRKYLFSRLVAVAAMLGLCAWGVVPVRAATAPAEIKVGTLYASSGPFAVASQGQIEGLRFWADGVNKTGGVFVKAFDKKIPVKIIAYDDQSSTATATTLYNQLITQDHVDVLVADFGSVLTSVALPLAKVHHMLLIDPTGSGANFFTEVNNDIADVSIPSSQVWPVPLAEFLLQHKIKRVAVLYGANDFNASQATTLKEVLGKGGVTPVYFHSVPTTESNYTVLLHTIAATNPDAVIEMGYGNNDIAFLKTLKSSGLHFNMVFTIFPGQLFDLITKNVGADALAYTYTYPTPPIVRYNDVNLGLGIDAFSKDFMAAHKKDPNFLDVAGYNTGLVIQDMVARAPAFTQLDFRKALGEMSGKTKTILGEFNLTSHGAQIGQLLPVAQLQPQKDGSNKVVVVYPEKVATGKPIYPAPKK